eukprot:scaffold13227_cov117-Isochrysis_galbana.AAC.18
MQTGVSRVPERDRRALPQRVEPRPECTVRDVRRTPRLAGSTPSSGAAASSHTPREQSTTALSSLSAQKLTLPNSKTAARIWPTDWISAPVAPSAASALVTRTNSAAAASPHASLSPDIPWLRSWKAAAPPAAALLSDASGDQSSVASGRRAAAAAM